MNTAATVAPATIEVDEDALRRVDPGDGGGGGGGRASAFVELTKPRINLLLLLTVGIGYLCGDRRGAGLASMWLTIAGAGLVAGGASAWNQVLERDRDRRMRRTRGRPLPSGRVSPAEAAAFGSGLALAGLAILVAFVNVPAAIVAAATLVLYVVIYTPSKPITTLNTIVGAVPGALPPVIGYSAATGRVGVEGITLFLILFLWQFPHFLAIAWIYREDYARGGYRMLPILDAQGRLTGRQATTYAMALVPAGLLPSVVGLAGPAYFVGALLLGAYYLIASARFWRAADVPSARRLMFASFFYLPLILLLLVLDPSR